MSGRGVDVLGVGWGVGTLVQAGRHLWGGGFLLGCTRPPPSAPPHPTTTTHHHLHPGYSTPPPTPLPRHSLCSRGPRPTPALHHTLPRRGPRWVQYYLAHDCVGPTRGVPWDYVAPPSAFNVLATTPTMGWGVAAAPGPADPPEPLGGGAGGEAGGPAAALLHVGRRDGLGGSGGGGGVAAGAAAGDGRAATPLDGAQAQARPSSSTGGVSGGSGPSQLACPYAPSELLAYRQVGG